MCGRRVVLDTFRMSQTVEVMEIGQIGWVAIEDVVFMARIDGSQMR